MDPMLIARKFEQAVKMHRNGDLKGAEEIYLQIQQAIPLWQAVNLNLAALYTQQKEFRKALKYNMVVLESSPSSQDALRNQYTILLGLDQREDALEIILKLVEMDPKAGHLRFNLGTLLFQMGELDEASDQLKLAVEFLPEMPEAYQNLGALQMELGLLKEAKGNFQKAIELRPDYALAIESLDKVERAML